MLFTLPKYTYLIDQTIYKIECAIVDDVLEEFAHEIVEIVDFVLVGEGENLAEVGVGVG